MRTLDEIKKALAEVLDDRPRRQRRIEAFQSLVWEADEIEGDPSIETLVRDLAYDLDFYRADGQEADDPSFFGDARLEKKVKVALERLADAK